MIHVKKSRSVRLILLLMCTLLCSACLPVVYAVPPTKLNVGFGAHVSDHKDRDRGGHFDIRAGVYPLQLFYEKEGRTYDVGLGYGYQDDLESTYHLHGPYAEFGFLGLFDDFARWGISMQVQGLSDSRQESTYLVGGRGALQLHVEFGDHQDGPFESCETAEGEGFCGVGYAWGEGSVGLYLESGYGTVRGLTTWDFGVGLLMRIPAQVGFGFVMLDSLHDEED